MDNFDLPSQACFSWLSMPLLQHVDHSNMMDVVQNQGDCEPLPRPGSASSLKFELTSETDSPYRPVNHISSEVLDLLLAYEASAARRADECDAAGSVSCITTSLFDCNDPYEPERILASSAPPKRFFKTFWTSACIRLLIHEKQRRIALCRVRSVE